MIVDICTYGTDSHYQMAIYPRESRRKRASWILWLAEDGSGVLHLKRSETGATLDEGIILPASVSRKKK